MRARSQARINDRLDETAPAALTRASLEGWEAIIREQTAEIGRLSAETLRFQTAIGALSLQKLIDLVPDNLWVKDAASRFVIANQATARRMGFAASSDLIGKTDLELCPAETAQKYHADERRVVETGEPLIDCEEYVIAADGGKTWISTTKAPMCGDGGEVVGLVGISRDISARKEIDSALVAARERIRNLLSASPAVIYSYKATGDFAPTFVSENIKDLLGYDPQEYLASADFWRRCVHPDDFDAAEADAAQLFREGAHKFEYRFLRKDGSYCWVGDEQRLVTNTFGEPVEVVGSWNDITARKQAETSREGQAGILEMIATGAPLADVLDRLTRLIESQLPQVRSAVLLLDEDGAPQRRGAAPSLPEAFVMAIDRLRAGARAGFCGAAACAPQVIVDLASDPRWADFRELAAAYRIRFCWWKLILSHQGQALGTFALFSGGAREPSEAESHLIDVAAKIAGIAIERKLAEERIQFMATHDALTGLPNRTLLEDRLTQAVLMAQRYDRWATVAFIDIDHFKYVNDSLGHSAGDELLKTIAGRMVACLRPTDTVLRLGGDEFVVVLCDQAKSIEGLTATLRSLQAAIAEPIDIDRRCLRVTGSLGVATYPHDGADAQSLLANADAAMYRAKENGRDNIQFYRPDINDRVQEKFRMQEELRMAVARNEFVLFYQPQVNLRTRVIFAVEALIRWNHPTEGRLLPSRFIPLAEETGLIEPIGEWVIRESCRQAKEWQNAGLPPLRVSVNVSARQFKERNLPAVVAAALRDAALEARFLELELTESLIMQHIDQAVATMEELERLGVQLSIDDFGTGYSSLAALKTFPVARLKIDRAFIKGLPCDKDDMAVATAVISLGQKLNLKVIAEGVETEEQAAFLRQHNCDEIQGFHLSKPIPPREFEAFLKDWAQRGGEAAPLSPARRPGRKRRDAEGRPLRRRGRSAAPHL